MGVNIIKTFTFTEKELRALKEVVFYGYLICSDGCVYPQMQNSKKDCDECEFTININNILGKLKGL